MPYRISDLERDLKEVTDNIDAIKAERDKAREALSQEAREAERYRALLGTVRVSNARLTAQVERLKQALETIASGDGTYGAQAHEYKQIARTALQPNEGK